MAARLQARGRHAGAACTHRVCPRRDRMVADVACRLPDRRSGHPRALAVDDDRHQSGHRCIAGQQSRQSRRAIAGADRQMGRSSRHPNRARRDCHDRVLLGMLVAPTMTTDLSDPATPTHYAFKPSLMGAAHQFELTDGGLSWRLAGRSGVWPYTDISAIQLSYRPVTMQADRFRADIHHARRARITVVSSSWQTAALMAAENRDYWTFILELH